MKLRLAAALLLLALSSGCSKDNVIGPTQTEFTDAEYAVLAAIVDSSHMVSSDVTIVVQDSTSSGAPASDGDSTLIQTLQYVNEHVPELRAETIMDFRSKNLSRSFVERPTMIRSTCVLASTTDKVFPSLQVSRVGFSADGQQAVAYTGIVSAPLAGAGYYFVLSLQNGIWTITGSVMIWIS